MLRSNRSALVWCARGAGGLRFQSSPCATAGLRPTKLHCFSDEYSQFLQKRINHRDEQEGVKQVERNVAHTQANVNIEEDDIDKTRQLGGQQLARNGGASEGACDRIKRQRHKEGAPQQSKKMNIGR